MKVLNVSIPYGRNKPLRMKQRWVPIYATYSHGMMLQGFRGFPWWDFLDSWMINIEGRRRATPSTTQLEDSWRRSFVNCTSGTSKDPPISPLHRPLHRGWISHGTSRWISSSAASDPHQTDGTWRMGNRLFCNEKTGPWLFRVYGG